LAELEIVFNREKDSRWISKIKSPPGVLFY